MSKLQEMQTPIFAAEGVLDVTTDDFRLIVGGLIDTPKIFTWNEFCRLPSSRINARLTSVSGWSVRVNWDGIAWSDFLANVSLQSSATHVTFTSYGDYDTTVSLKDLENPRVVLAWGVDGEPLEPEYGGPLRIVIPNLWGYKSCKWIAKIDFVEGMQGGYWEDRGYTRSGIIEPGETFDVNTKTWRHIKGGEVLEF
jgi:DMSO/TMAO reductase YedYZ molybdopterin-dependent catalytic subunit